MEKDGIQSAIFCNIAMNEAIDQKGINALNIKFLIMNKNTMT